MRMLLIACLCSVAGAAEYVTIHKDFVDDFDPASVSNSASAMASLKECSDYVQLPGIFLHTKGLEDTVLVYDTVAVPEEEGRRAFLVFRIGFRDGVPWDTDTAPPNGVRFMVTVNGAEAFREESAGVGWQARAVDVTPLAGQEIAVEFRTNAIDGNTSYDWASFGHPLLVSVPTAGQALARDTVGLALVEVVCAEASSVVLTMRSVRESVRSVSGTHWVPLSFEEYEAPVLEVESGKAALGKTLAAAHLPELTELELALSSPLVTVGDPFKLLLSTKNVGLGNYTGSDSMVPEAQGLGASANKALELGPLAPGESQTLRWEGLVASEPGEKTLGMGDAEVAFYAFPEAPETSAEHSEEARVEVTYGEPVVAAVSNAWSRLSFVLGEAGYAYAIAETWDGGQWQRVGSLYPLADVRILDAERKRFPLKITRSGNSLVVRAMSSCRDRGNQAIVSTFTPDADSPRIRVTTELTSSEDVDLLLFHGPTVLAGDRAYGVEKDFAIFPGLEYLEGDEESSSERDLAYPLCDRRVPLAHKIAAPLMAVQAEGALVSLLWDENEEWGPGEKLQAARFLAPKYDSGYGHIHMSLFAPSVGTYVRENEYSAASLPYPLKAEETLTLTSHLVLDHESRYAAGSVVHGPHKGGLVLQAMQHWFDVYGFPEPSEQPRDWQAERALCRDAFMHAVWSDDPPGWRHCHGWAPGLMTGYAVPLTLDLRAGVEEPDKSEVERRIGLVIDRAVKEQGKHYLWSSAGCHTLMAELPFYVGYVGESLADFKKSALARVAGRENGLWVWRPRDDKHATLGTPGDHTLGQASHPSFTMLRAARMTGDAELIAKALDAMKQMERYEVPRGAQVWECPLCQPDILASAQAIRAYCEAYRITGDTRHLDHARYWAWTGLPFLYLWELEGYPTMRYNVISVIGSTFYSHSWLGMPVVWCGLVYAYALQDLAEFDDSFDWRRVAQGITNSAMWQQYAEGPSKGTYPDSWNMVRNGPNPADINPENILVNEFRLRGQSTDIRFARFQGEDKAVMLNSAADIAEARLDKGSGNISFVLHGTPAYTAHTLLAQVPEPQSVAGAGERAADSDALRNVDVGWLYDEDLRGVVLKNRVTPAGVACEVRWQ